MLDWSQELLLVDKPLGITSFDVIRRLRRIYSDTHGGNKAPKLGHAGTLDPLASGLMLIGVGSGTKRLAEFIKLDKEYLATVRLGESRLTGDLEGEVTEEVVGGDGGAAAWWQSTSPAALHNLHGTHPLPVSAYSAIKVDGVPLYKRARQAAIAGDTIVDVPVRNMTVYESELLDINHVNERLEVSVRLLVASGTYVRSLAEALGRQLGYPACLSSLRRTRVGDFTIEQASPLSQ